MDAIGHLRLRLAWADEHIRGLKGEIDAFMWAYPYKLMAERDEYSGKGQIRFVVTRPLPTTWSLMIGDIAHNIRSTLDHLVYDLALTTGNAPPRSLAFPICSDAAYFQQIRQRRIGVLPIRLQTKIEKLQPYYRRNRPERHPLWVLKELSDIDKHRESHLTYSSLSDLAVNLTAEGGTVIHHRMPRIQRIEDGTVVRKFTTRPPDAKLYFEVDGTLNIVFDEAGVARGGAVVQTLHVLHEYVAQKVLPRFERDLH